MNSIFILYSIIYEIYKRRNKKLLTNHEYSLKEMFNALFHMMYDVESDKYVYHYNY